MKLEQLMVIALRVQEPISTGPVPAGEARVIPFVDGTFEGRDLRGKLLAGGTDWQRIRSNNVLEIRAHYMLQTDREENIEVISEGLRSASAEVLERLAAGEEVPKDAYYFRTFVRLNTAAPRLAWVNDRLFLGAGVRRVRAVEITVLEVP